MIIKGLFYRCIKRLQQKSETSNLLLVIACFSYHANGVTLAEEDLVHDQLGFVVVDVLNCNVDFHKWLESYKETTARRR